jgi:hypothetical protein
MVKLQRKCPLGKPETRREDDIVHHREVGYEDMKWIELFQVCVQLQASYEH